MNASVSLVDELMAQLQGAPLQQMASQLGATPAQTEDAVGAALPLLLGALGRNAAAPQGAADLFGALQRDHGDGPRSGGPAGRDAGAVAQLRRACPAQADGAAILGHIFGGSQERAQTGLGQATGLGAGAGQLLQMLAPIVMSFLAQRMRAGGMDAGGLGQVLGQEHARVQQQDGLAGGLLGQLLDQDGDGQVGPGRSAQDGQRPAGRAPLNRGGPAHGRRRHCVSHGVRGGATACLGSGAHRPACSAHELAAGPLVHAVLRARQDALKLTHVSHHFSWRPFMTAVADILRSKRDNTVHRIGPDDSVFDALQRMADKGIGALMVMEGDAIVGIVTERDYARKIALLGRKSSATLVRDVMTADVMYVQPAQTSEECMALMTENRLRHLPVVEGGKLVGLISIGDLVKDIISEQKFIIEQLEHYITGGGR